MKENWTFDYNENNENKVIYESLPPLSICTSNILIAASREGKKGLPSHDPTAIELRKVWSDVLCCMNPSFRRPTENARSPSTDVA